MGLPPLAGTPLWGWAALIPFESISERMKNNGGMPMKSISLWLLILALLLPTLAMAQTLDVTPFPAPGPEETDPVPEALASPEAPVNHIIWNIPWGISPEEFIQTARQTTGIEFEETQEKEDILCEAVEGQEILVYGYPVHYVYAGFPAASHSYTSLRVGLTDFGRVPFEYHMAMVNGLYHDLLSKYKVCDEARLIFFTESKDVISLAMPWDGRFPDQGRFETEEIRRIAGNERYIVLSFRFGNISLDSTMSFYQEDQSEVFRWVTLSASSQENPPENEQRNTLRFATYDDYQKTLPTPTPTLGF